MGGAMIAYYNEFDPFAAQWLRNLIAREMIAPGDVDERSIVDVQPGDLKGYTQCHFFAGIGGWSLALRMAGWADDKPAWTGSCPCQPLSSAGQRKGHADERHLWPAFHRLIAECHPATVFGEQVASADGREWLAGIRADLEDLGYACGAADLCAAGVGAPHIRQRLFWVGDTERHGLRACGGGATNKPDQSGNRPVCQAWARYIVREIGDGIRRRLEPGLEPLAPRDAGTYGRLRAYGNAIVPQVAAEFVAAVLECAP
jgi:DNA (cytosine-5)-methyltransferase 1